MPEPAVEGNRARDEGVHANLRTFGFLPGIGCLQGLDASEIMAVALAGTARATPLVIRPRCRRSGGCRRSSHDGLFARPAHELA
jgi:hypothetical protein